MASSHWPDYHTRMEKILENCKYANVLSGHKKEVERNSENRRPIEFNWPFNKGDEEFLLMMSLERDIKDTDEPHEEYRDNLNSFLVYIYVINQYLFVAIDDSIEDRSLSFPTQYLVKNVYHAANQIISQKKIMPVKCLLQTYLKSALKIILSEEDELVKVEVLTRVIELITSVQEKLLGFHTFYSHQEEVGIEDFSEVFSAAVVLNNDTLNKFMAENLSRIYETQIAKYRHDLTIYVSFVREIIYRTLKFEEMNIGVVNNFIKNIIPTCPNYRYSKKYLAAMTPMFVFKIEQLLSKYRPNIYAGFEIWNTYYRKVLEFSKMIFDYHPLDFETDREKMIKEKDKEEIIKLLHIYEQGFEDFAKSMNPNERKDKALLVNNFVESFKKSFKTI